MELELSSIRSQHQGRLDRIDYRYYLYGFDFDWTGVGNWIPACFKSLLESNLSLLVIALF